MRFMQGMAWGAIATLAMAGVIMLAIGVGAWPTDRPLSALFVGELLGAGCSGRAALLLAVAGHLAYGAFCGGLLSSLAEPVTIHGALGLSSLRWLITQLVVMPALGWGPFGLLRTPLIALITAVPHIVFGLVLGWGMRRQDERSTPLWLGSRYRWVRS